MPRGGLALLLGKGLLLPSSLLLHGAKAGLSGAELSHLFADGLHLLTQLLGLLLRLSGKGLAPRLLRPELGGDARVR